MIPRDPGRALFRGARAGVALLQPGAVQDAAHGAGALADAGDATRGVAMRAGGLQGREEARKGLDDGAYARRVGRTMVEG